LARSWILILFSAKITQVAAIKINSAKAFWPGLAALALIMLPDQALLAQVQKANTEHEAQEINVPAPPFSPDIFPCSQCHQVKDLPPNTQRRQLTDMHQEIQLKHGDSRRWCLDCHDIMDRDQLHDASGEKIDFSESFKLCGQCHGIKLRDWRAGVHGKRTGLWNGQKHYLLCVHCHNPHDPAFKPLKPEPPPRHSRMEK
jgi:hypothetical protein